MVTIGNFLPSLSSIAISCGFSAIKRCKSSSFLSLPYGTLSTNAILPFVPFFLIPMIPISSTPNSVLMLIVYIFYIWVHPPLIYNWLRNNIIKLSLLSPPLPFPSPPSFSFSKSMGERYPMAECSLFCCILCMKCAMLSKASEKASYLLRQTSSCFSVRMKLSTNAFVGVAPR